MEHSNIDFAINVLGVKGRECFVDPLVHNGKLGFCHDQKDFVLSSGAFYTDTPWLVEHHFIESGSVNVYVGISGKGNVQCHVLEVANGDGGNALQK